MPRYFFDVSNGQHNVDDEGTVLTDAAEARRQGIVAAAAMFGEEGASIATGDIWTMRISDEARTVVCTIRVSVSASVSASPASVAVR